MVKVKREAVTLAVGEKLMQINCPLRACLGLAHNIHQCPLELQGLVCLKACVPGTSVAVTRCLVSVSTWRWGKTASHQKNSYLQRNLGHKAVYPTDQQGLPKPGSLPTIDHTSTHLIGWPPTLGSFCGITFPPLSCVGLSKIFSAVTAGCSPNTIGTTEPQDVWGRMGD